MDLTSTIELEHLLSIFGHVNGRPRPRPPPPPPPHPIVQQPITSMAPQRPMQPGLLYGQAVFYGQGQYNNLTALPLLGYLPDRGVVYLFTAPATVKTEPTTVKTEQTTVKTEQTTVKTEQTTVKTEQTAVKTEPTAVKTEPAAVKTKPVKTEQTTVKTEPVKTEQTTVKTEPATVKTKRRKCVEDGPYVKKPPNAFMVFMTEQRPKYAAEMKTSGCAVINAILGQNWTSLSKDEQAKYYEQADAEKLRHAQCHPDWTSSNNYGVKRKRDRSKAAKLAAKLAEASASGEVTQQAKKPCVASVSTEVVEAPPTNTRAMKPSNLETTPSQGPATEASATGKASSRRHLVVGYESLWLDDYESFWLDFYELDEVKELNFANKWMDDKPAPPEIEARSRTTGRTKRISSKK